MVALLPEGLLRLPSGPKLDSDPCQPLVCALYRISVRGKMQTVMCGPRKEGAGIVDVTLIRCPDLRAPQEPASPPPAPSPSRSPPPAQVHAALAGTERPDLWKV